MVIIHDIAPHTDNISKNKTNLVLLSAENFNMLEYCEFLKTAFYVTLGSKFQCHWNGMPLCMPQIIIFQKIQNIIKPVGYK